MDEFKYSIELEEQNIFIHQYVHKIGGYRYNWHNEIEIMMILNGKVEVCVEGEVHHLKEGDIILINANHGHASLKEEEDSIAMVLHINPIYISTFYPDYKYLKFDCISNDKTRDKVEFKLLREYLVKMIKSIEKNTPESRFETIGNLGILVSHLFKYFPPNKIDITNIPKDTKSNHLLKDIINYIEKNYYKKVYLNDIAKLINYNSNYTSSFFKSSVGINFYDYLSRVRLQHAISELIATDKPVSVIAIENGFSDVKIFNNYFRKNFNQSPSKYRNDNSKIDPDLSFLNRKYISLEDKIVKEKLKKFYNPSENEIKNKKNYIDKNEKEINDAIQIDFIEEQKNEIMNLIKNLNIKLNIELKK